MAVVAFLFSDSLIGFPESVSFAIYGACGGKYFIMVIRKWTHVYSEMAEHIMGIVHDDILSVTDNEVLKVSLKEKRSACVYVSGFSYIYVGFVDANDSGCIKEP